MDEILNLEQAIELFGVSERTMIKILNQEQLPARKIGREWRFSKEALIKWLSEGNSLDYANQTDQYRIHEDISGSANELYVRIKDAITQLENTGGNIKTLFNVNDAIPFIREKATLRISFKKQRGLEKLTFKIFWLAED